MNQVEKSGNHHNLVEEIQASDNPELGQLIGQKNREGKSKKSKTQASRRESVYGYR